MKPSRIAVFDSGVGGLSVFESVQKKLPHCEYIYFADSENFPYGNKEEAHVRDCVSNSVAKLIKRYSPDLLVVACNTASTVTLDELRSKFPIPIVGVVPALKPAALLSKTKRIGLLATPATVKQPYIDRLVEEFCEGVEVIRVGSTKLVELAEHKLSGGTISLSEIRKEVEPLFQHGNLDTVVLGCTHFPLLLEELKAVSPEGTEWVDSGEAIALRVHSLLDWKEEIGVGNRVCVSGRVPVRSGLVSAFRSFGFSTVEMI